MRPATLGGAPVGGSEGQQLVTFSYSASVPRTPAYQGTEVTAPEPVFRRLANTVEVGIDYEGTPGVVAVDAELSTDSGWRWTLPLAEAQDVPDGRYEGIVTLELDALERRAAAGARAAGIPMSPVSVVVSPVVTSGAGEFRPSLPFRLTPESLTLVNPEQGLTIQEGASSVTPAWSNSFTVLGMTFGVWFVRILGLAAVLLGLGVLLWLRMLPDSDQRSRAAVSRRRHSELIVPVTQVDLARGPLVEVPDLDELARIAKRYALLILHWSDAAADVYFVHDETATYRCYVPKVPRVPTRSEDGEGVARS